MSRRTLLITLMAGGLCILGLFIADKALPYSLDDKRRLKAMDLVGGVRSYAAVGDTNLAPMYKTNTSVRVFPFFTNIPLNGVVYRAVIGLEDTSFRRTGFVACTTNAEAIWIDTQGKARMIDFRRRRWE